MHIEHFILTRRALSLDRQRLESSKGRDEGETTSTTMQRHALRSQNAVFIFNSDPNEERLPQLGKNFNGDLHEHPS